MPVVDEPASRLELAVPGVLPVWVVDAEPWHREATRWAVPGLWDAPRTGRAGSEVAALESAVAALEQVDPRLLPEADALAEAEAILRLQQRLRVLQLDRLADVERRELYATKGFHGMRGWLASAGPDAVEKDRTLARRLERLPHVRSAVRSGLPLRGAQRVADALAKVDRLLDRPDGLVDGQPGEEVVTAVVGNVVDLVARGLGGLDDDAPVLLSLQARTAGIACSGDSQAARVEQALVLLAEHLTDDRALKAALEEQVFAILPNLLEQQQEEAEERRGASLRRRPDGSWDLEARLTPACGERLHVALAAEARRDAANPVDTETREQQRRAQAEAEGRDRFTDPEPVPAWEREAVTAFGRPVDEPLVPRSRSRRLHDALDRLLQRYLEKGLGGTHDKVPVQVVVTLPSYGVEAAPGALPARGSTGRPLARSLVRRWWCDAHVTALLMSRGWKPLGLVHSGRTLVGVERRASLTQHDQRCAGVDCCPGAPDPLVPLVPHHLFEHSRFGRTSLDETVWLCPTAHHDVHTGKRRVRLRDGRVIDEDGPVRS